MLSTLHNLTLEHRSEWEDDFSEADEKRLRTELGSVCRGIEQLAQQRNAILHARWVRGEQGSPLTYVVQARGTLKRSLKGMSAQHIESVAKQIAEHSQRIREFFEIEEVDRLEETE